MMRSRLSDWRLWCLAAATILCVVTAVVPRIERLRPVYDVMAIIDITGSMNTRDMKSAGLPGGDSVRSRLDAAKSAVSGLLQDLPCQSRLGLGVFTERRSFVLFNPVEVCENFAAIDAGIAGLDWRMGWEGDSLVGKGVYSALTIAAQLKADVVFLTDGHEAPPLPIGAQLYEFDGDAGHVKGLIVGVGGDAKVPIPKFDDDGRLSGVYSAQDVPQENHSGPPPKDAESRPGYHPKWAPYGKTEVEGDEHLTSVRGEYLTRLAGQVGLGYAPLTSMSSILKPLAPALTPREVVVAVDVRPLLGGLALFILSLVYAAPLVQRAARVLPYGNPGVSP